MLLSLRGIRKSFGGVHALRDGNLEVNSGEVHLLMGENGAGKSTLMKIVAGLHQRDGGEMLWHGNPVSFTKPSEASQQGIAMVHQESLLAPHLSVAENIYLGRETNSKLGWVHRQRMVQNASRLIAEHHFRLDPQARVEKLTPAGKQLVEICRAIAHGSNLLIFDEPTSSLSETETAEVFRIVRELCSRNIGVIYITHRLDELRSIGDRVTILRDGVTVHSGALRDLTREQLIRHMVGRPMEAFYHRKSRSPGETLLRVRNVCGGILNDISFEVKAGEIVGLGGLMGAGRTELCRVLFGLDSARSGSVEIVGRPVNPRSPRQAVGLGLALIPEDRQSDGLALRLPVAFNLTLPALDRISSFGILKQREEANLYNEYRDKLRIKSSSSRQISGRLSGGNQQKVAIAKWMAKGARVFLFDEPTRGIDIGAKQEVFEQMDALAQSGAAILMVSSELPELIQMADRIVVMCQGRITGELPGQTTQEQIMRLAAPVSAMAMAADR